MRTVAALLCLCGCEASVSSFPIFRPMPGIVHSIVEALALGLFPHEEKVSLAYQRGARMWQEPIVRSCY